MEIIKLCKFYNKKRLFNELNISIKNHKTILIGSNGAGKTTLLLILAGIEKYNSGKIIWDDSQKIVKKEEISISSDCIQLPVFLSLKQVIELTAKVYKSEYPHDLLLKFNIDQFSDVSLKNLSQGTLKKINIILALIKPSKMVLLDEPTVSLDKESVKNLINVINDDSRKFLISTHEEQIFKKVCTSRIVIG
tara:strand:+ start:1027 stop:1602 length:576 start_codon:yes stop_codon:yes gene_type:complete